MFSSLLFLMWLKKKEPANVPAYQFSSGGGFSTYAKQPAWQSQAVQKYLSARGVKLPPSKDFTKTNRGRTRGFFFFFEVFVLIFLLIGFPDVAAAGWQIVIQLGNGCFCSLFLLVLNFLAFRRILAGNRRNLCI